MQHDRCRAARTALKSNQPTHLSEMLISSSTVTGRLTWPEMANSLVPWLFCRGVEAERCKWVRQNGVLGMRVGCALE